MTNEMAANAQALTPQGRIDALYRRIDLECGSIAREWGNSEEIDILQSALYAKIEVIKAEIESIEAETESIKDVDDLR